MILSVYGFCDEYGTSLMYLESTLVSNIAGFS